MEFMRKLNKCKTLFVLSILTPDPRVAVATENPVRQAIVREFWLAIYDMSIQLYIG